MQNSNKIPTVADAWQDFITNGRLCNSIKPEIQHSWLRCIEHLNPLQNAPLEKLEKNRLNELKEKNELLLRVSEPIMNDLYSSIKGSGFSVILSDNQGYILKVIGDSNFLESSSKVHLTEGVNWNEKVKGTNAIGVSLYENRPITIFANEHFFQKNHFLTCSAAPIYDSKSNIIGIIDVSGYYKAAHPHNLGLALATAKAIQHNYILKETKQLKKEEQYYISKYSFDSIIGESNKIKDTIKLAKKAAQSESTILLYGESGTGKELFAHAIHTNSKKNTGPFVAINCGAFPENLIESELFGYDAGAFTGAKAQGKVGKLELANGGSLFLDEISELPLDAQSTLLRVLQDRCFTRIGGNKPIPIDVRIIAATNKDLYEEVNKGKFRLDLFYRINVLSIEIPPLRERIDDLDILTNHYLGKLGNIHNNSMVKLSPKVKEIFYQYWWPGNIRELINVLERSLHLIDDNLILPEHIPIQIKRLNSQSSGSAPLSLKSAEENMIKAVLSQTGHNISKAAELLGIGRATLYRKLEKYNLK